MFTMQISDEACDPVVLVTSNQRKIEMVPLTEARDRELPYRFLAPSEKAYLASLDLGEVRCPRGCPFVGKIADSFGHSRVCPERKSLKHGGEEHLDEARDHCIECGIEFQEELDKRALAAAYLDDIATDSSGDDCSCGGFVSYGSTRVLPWVDPSGGFRICTRQSKSRQRAARQVKDTDLPFGLKNAAYRAAYVAAMQGSLVKSREAFLKGKWSSGTTRTKTRQDHR